MTNEGALGMADRVARLPLSDRNSETVALVTLAAAYRDEKAITDRLPKTADGVGIIPHANGHLVWWCDLFGNTYYNRNVVQGGDGEWYAYCGWMPENGLRPNQEYDPNFNDCRLLSLCYSTREAALAARTQEHADGN